MFGTLTLLLKNPAVNGNGRLQSFSYYHLRDDLRLASENDLDRVFKIDRQDGNIAYVALPVDTAREIKGLLDSLVEKQEYIGQLTVEYAVGGQSWNCSPEARAKVGSYNFLLAPAQPFSPSPDVRLCERVDEGAGFEAIVTTKKHLCIKFISVHCHDHSGRYSPEGDRRHFSRIRTGARVHGPEDDVYLGFGPPGY